MLAGNVNYKSSKIDDLFDSDEERPATGRVIFQNRSDTDSFLIEVIRSTNRSYSRSLQLIFRMIGRNVCYI